MVDPTIESIDANWKPVVLDKRPPRPVTWRDVWRGSPWLITVFGALVLLAVLSFVWGVVVGW